MSRDPYESLRHALTIIPLIQAHQGMTLKELQSRTGLTEPQITQELGRLVMMCGVPPYAPNNYVSFWVEDGRVYVRFAEQFERPVRLVLQEALALVMALRPLETRNHPFRDAVRRLRGKILDVLGPEGSAALGQMQRTFHLETRHVGERISKLRDAMARCQELRIVYWSAHRAQITERVIRPYGMVEHDGDWFVVAHDSVRGEPVTFRVDRIREAELLETEFEVPADFDVARWSQDRHFVPPAGGTVAEVLFEQDVARYAREELPRKDVTELPDGRLLARVRVASEVWFLSWLLTFGKGAEVLGPPEIRALVRDACRKILDEYDRPAPVRSDGV
jgi:proteasome accessory factor C